MYSCVVKAFGPLSIELLHKARRLDHCLLSYCTKPSNALVTPLVLGMKYHVLFILCCVFVYFQDASQLHMIRNVECGIGRDRRINTL